MGDKIKQIMKQQLKKIAKTAIKKILVPASISLLIIVCILAVIISAAQSLGLLDNKKNVNYYNQARDMTNTTDLSFGGKITYNTISLNESDINSLYQIAAAERGDGTQKQQEYIVSVVLNRVLCSRFPNTVSEVIFADPDQFQSINNIDLNQISNETKSAVSNVIKTGDTTKGAVYFITSEVNTTLQDWLSNNAMLLVSDDGYDFYTTQDDLDSLQPYRSTKNVPTVTSKDPDFYTNYANQIESDTVLQVVNFALTQEGKKLRQLKTEYSDIWTVPEDNWCADFISFCFTYHNLVGEGKAIPYWQRAANLGFKKWVTTNTLKGKYVPKPGDVLVFSWSHVGLVYGCDGTFVYVVEGNSQHNNYRESVVALTKYALTAGEVFGYYPSSRNIK